MSNRQPLNAAGVMIQKCRKAKNLTQEELAAKCHLVGFDIGRETISQIERQVRGVSDLELILIAKALRVEVSHLVPDVLPKWRKDLRPPNATE